MPVDASTQARSSARGQERSDAPVDYWKKSAPDVKFGRERFRMTWIPHIGKQQVIDSNVEQLDWDDSTAVMTGTIQLRDPSYGATPEVGLGDEIMLEVSLGGQGNWIELWRMRIVEPYRAFVARTRTHQLTNVLGWLAQSVDDFVYLADKAHPKGWTADEIVLDIAKRYNVPVGVIAKCTHRIKRLVLMDSSPLKAIAEAYKRERAYTDRRFVISADHGKLNVTPLRRNPRLLELGASLIDAGFRESLNTDFATALTVRATGKTVKGKDKKGHSRTTTQKILVKVSSATAVAKFGYVHRNVWAHDADTSSEASSAGLRHIARVGLPTKELTLTHPGIPTIRRGDAIRALLPVESLKQVIYLTSAQHAVSANGYSMTLGVMFTDPWVDAKLDSVNDQRDVAAAKRGRKSGTAKKKKKAAATQKSAKADKRSNKTTPGQRLTAKGHP